MPLMWRVIYPGADLTAMRDGDTRVIGHLADCPHCHVQHITDRVRVGAEIKICSRCRKAFALVDDGVPRSTQTLKPKRGKA